MFSVFRNEEDIVESKENAGYQDFLPFLSGFETGFSITGSTLFQTTKFWT